MTDIVQKLRLWQIHATHKLHADLGEAADEIESLRQQLADSQAREVVMRDALNDVLANATVHFPEHMIWPIESALAMPSDSTALDAMLKHAKREALLEAADWADNCGERLADSTFSGLASQYRRMAKELE